MPSSNSPKSSIAFKALRQKSARVREVSFSKRCVELRGVASVYRQRPLELLLVAFQKSRRAARTDKFLRMSRRLAGPQSRIQSRIGARVSAGFEERTVKKFSVQNCVRFSCVEALQSSEANMASKRSNTWRQLSDCVSIVLRDVRVVTGPSVERPVSAKLN